MVEYNRKEPRQYRFDKMLKLIFSICDLMGFEIQGRITFKDRKTGKIYK